MKSELERTLADVPTYKYVKCFGLHGTYDDGLAWMQTPQNAAKPKAILSLGSSIGNFTREEAPAFLAQYMSFLGPRDMLLIGLDACQEPEKVYLAYNDSDGWVMCDVCCSSLSVQLTKHSVTHEFTLNGLKHANRLLDYEAFKSADWEAVGEYDEQGGRHRAFVVPNKDLTIEGVALSKGERIRIEESYKYNSQGQCQELWRASGGFEACRWCNDANYGRSMWKRSRT